MIRHRFRFSTERSDRQFKHSGRFCRKTFDLGEDARYNLPMDVREAEVAAGVAVSEALVIQT